ncbi:MAG: hypothetical protein KBT46_07435 [Ruminococcus sp.]|nr:hypothetical protein [Candidatus Copronaster equi]
MKIRYSSPIVFTNDSSEIIAQMEAVGFKVTHKKENAGGTNVTFISMKDNNDHPMMIAENARFTTPFSGIRLNVDDFEEALAKFTAMGYINLQAGATDTGTSHATLLRSPEGIFVSIGEHTVG